VTAVEGARTATDDDLGELVRLAKDGVTAMRDQRGGALWLAHLADDRVEDDGFRALLADEAHEVVLGTLDDVAVGYAVAERTEIRSPRTGEVVPLAVIRQLYVEPGARAVGVGEALVEHRLDWARAAGCTGIEGFALPGDRDTKNLFERFGLVARAILVHRSLEGDG
jgi:GNAT superfamily N-acetyltransferase